MKPQLKKLKDQVIVITGASSGIGLTTAEIAAANGAAVVLAARSEDALALSTAAIRERGGRAAAIAGDVADPLQVEAIADVALREFGRIDTWVNNAGISMYGDLTDVPLSDKRRVFDVTFWGVVHGSETAVPHLSASRGALINIGSILSDIAVPLQGIYTAAKHAVKGYTDALRLELEARKMPVSVTLIKPGAIDTPYTQHARNYLAYEPKHPQPVYPPEEVAHAILRCAQKPMREIVVGGMPRAMVAMHAIAPRLVDRYTERAMPKAQQSEMPAYSDDSLYVPSGEDYGRRRSSTGVKTMRTARYTRAMLSDGMRAAPLVALGAAIAAVVVARR